MKKKVQADIDSDKVRDAVWETLMNNSHLLRYVTQEQQADVINELGDALLNDLVKVFS